MRNPDIITMTPPAKSDMEAFVAHKIWAPTLRRKQATSRDGTRISYDVVGEGDKVLLLANGLGGRLYAWEPLLDRYWRDYRIVTWDYRGLFDSYSPLARRKMQLAHHVDDAIAILDSESCSRAVLLGWSMGVQVSLDLAARYPDLVAGLVLLNGTYGHALSTAFQPAFSVPFLPKRLHTLIEFARRHPQIPKMLSTVLGYAELPSALALSVTAGPKALKMRPMLRRYMADMVGPSFNNFLGLFQEIDAHSVYHLLPEIEAHALVISGLLDPLTPASQSREIARRMPHAEHLGIARASHFCLLERPNVVLPAIDKFLKQHADW